MAIPKVLTAVVAGVLVAGVAIAVQQRSSLTEQPPAPAAVSPSPSPAVARAPSPVPAQSGSPVVSAAGPATRAPSPSPAPPAPERAPAQVVRDYYRALTEKQAEEARHLLTVSAQERNSLADVEEVAESVESIAVSRLEGLSTADDWVVYRAVLVVKVAAGPGSDWSEGVNERFIEVLLTDAGWRINRVSSVAPAGATTP
jgi:hypothetical protein